MKRETYKGRKLKVIKGRGAELGYTRATVNGVLVWKHLGNEDTALRVLRGTIDHVEQVGINGDRYRPEWYVPGTFELCNEGHATAVGGECLHSWCSAQRANRLVG